MTGNYQANSGGKGIGEFLLLVCIVMVAFFLRTANLDGIPPGITHDEAAHLNDAQRIVEGYRPIYLTTAYGREPFYDYVTAPFIYMLGIKIETGRLVSAIWGTTLVVMVYAWCQIAFDRATAIISAALIAISFWPLSTSRQILRSVTMPVLLSAGIFLYWKALYSKQYWKRWVFTILTGFIFGLQFYSYMPARITWLIPALFGLTLLVAEKKRWQQEKSRFILMLVVMLIVALPLLKFLYNHPEMEVRVDELAEPLRDALDGKTGRLWRQIKETSLLFSHKGDIQWIYNISGKPLLPPVFALLFYFGLVLATFRFFDGKKPAYRLTLIWLVLGVSPALVTGLESSSLRAIAAQPAVFVLISLPIAGCLRRFWPVQNRKAKLALIMVLVMGGVILAFNTIDDYFNIWANQPNTKVAYHSHLQEIGRHLDIDSDSTPVTVSTLYPGPLHDPYAFQIILERDDLDLLWHNGKNSLIFPDSEQARMISTEVAFIDPVFKIFYQSSIVSNERIRHDEKDLVSWIEIVYWNPRKAIENLPLDFSINTGEHLLFKGYWLSTPQVFFPNSVIDIITFWEPIQERTELENLVLFTHLLNAGNEIVAQQDSLDVPVNSWQQNGLFAQLHRIEIPKACATGNYMLEIGAYTRSDMNKRLPVIQNNLIIDDKITLQEIRIVDSDSE